MNIKPLLLNIIMGVGLCTSCQGPIPYIDNVVLARVGDEKLTRPELRSAMPAGLSAADSIAYAQQYIRSWVDEQLLYRQGVHHLKNLKQIDEQVAEYRRTLIARTYEQQWMEKQVQDISDDECWTLYERQASRLKLERPVMQGLYVKTLTSAPQLDDLRRNLRDLQQGKADQIELIDTYCLQRAATYDNFFQRWVDVDAVLAKLPTTAEGTAASRLSQKGTLVEATDSLYTYLLFVKDYRAAGESKPYEYVLPDLRDQLLRRKRQRYRQDLLQRLYDEGIKKKVVVIAATDTVQ